MNVQDGLNVALNALSKSEIKELVGWGTYSTVGTKLTLADSMANYRFLLIRAGADTSAPNVGGANYSIFPIYLGGNYDPPAQFMVIYATGNSLYGISLVKNSDTELEVSAVRNFTSNSTSMNSGIRRIIGIK